VTDHGELPWGELKSQLLHFPHDTDLKILFRKTIRNKKRAAWAKFLHEQGHRHPWDIIRIAKDPSRHFQHMGDLTDEHDCKLVSYLEKVGSFQARHLVSLLPPNIEPNQDPLQPPTAHTPYRQANDHSVVLVRTALSQTKNSSIHGPDGISYYLLKLIQQTNLGQALLIDIATTILTGELGDIWRALYMVMIPKPGKDLALVKFWCPIALANTVWKLSDKVITNSLQQLNLFHDIQYGSRTGRSAVDLLMLIVSTAKVEMAKGARVTPLGRDIISAFNNLRSGPLLHTLTPQNIHPPSVTYISNFLHTRTFNIGWDGSMCGHDHMIKGFHKVACCPQYYSLSS